MCVCWLSIQLHSSQMMLLELDAAFEYVVVVFTSVRS